VKNRPPRSTYYDFLDSVRKFPGICLGGLNNDAVAGSKMPRLQAVLTTLHAAGLNQGEPPYMDFSPWFAARFDGIHESNNLPFHWLEERERGQDSAFDIFFQMLDEFRICKRVLLERSAGPFAPTFRKGDGRSPKHPNAIFLGRYSPSKVYFWATASGTTVERSPRFFRSRAAARAEVAAWWGVDRASWHPAPDPVATTARPRPPRRTKS
jgi:hypothetical protein